MSRTMCIALVAFVSLRSCATAQEFRVYSRITTTDSQAADGRPVVLSRSLTLWHAGKVYDLILPAGEVTILEPTHQRCWIVHSAKKLATRVEFDELRHLLRGAEERLAARIDELDSASNHSRDLRESLRFQLRPQFDTHCEPSERRLKLDSKLLSYDVTGHADVRREALDSYLTYADWMCRLNFVLHPQPVFPNARLELNEQLRRAGMLPSIVRLRTQLGQTIHLQATHELAWSLDGRDRASIRQWESLLRDPQITEVSLTDYRRQLHGQNLAGSSDVTRNGRRR